MAEHICPNCHCSFKQEFLCTTCGAEKLKDEATKQLERALHSKAEALMAQTNEIERLRKFHHDQQELHEMNEAVQQTNRLLREQLAKFERADEEHDRIARDAANARRQLAECERERDALKHDVQRHLAISVEAIAERDELVAALKHLLNAPQDPDAVDQAFAALAKLGADKEET